MIWGKIAVNYVISISAHVGSWAAGIGAGPGVASCLLVLCCKHDDSSPRTVDSPLLRRPPPYTLVHQGRMRSKVEWW